jgi:hypothetical protein
VIQNNATEIFVNMNPGGTNSRRLERLVRYQMFWHACGRKESMDRVKKASEETLLLAPRMAIE